MTGYERFPEYDNHKSIIELHDDTAGLRGFIALHSGNDHIPAFGATRLWAYKTAEDALRDALRLSRMMSYKSALAGLSYGGGKGVIIKPPEGNNKKKLLGSYVEAVNGLRGAFITGSDVGISQDDVTFMKGQSPYIVGLTADPTQYTAMGLFVGMRTTLDAMFGTDSFRERSIAIQGVGKIGKAILELIYPEAKEVIITDINNELLKSMKEKFPKVTVVLPEEIHKASVDIFAPCALAHALSMNTIPELRCRIVAGGANNQLESREAGEALFAKKILYAPDYVINAGGLISVVDEYEHGNAEDKRITERIVNIANTLEEIFQKSRGKQKPTNEVADIIAKEIISKRR